MQPKKKTRKKRGHRQEITRLMVNSINMNGSAIAVAEATPEATPEESTETAEAVEAEVVTAAE